MIKFWMVTHPVLQSTTKFIAKSVQKIKDFGNWLLDYILSKPKEVDEVQKSSLRTIQQKMNFIQNERVKICVEKVCNAVSNRRKRWVWS